MGSNIVLSGSIGTAAGSSILGNSAVVFATDANHTLSVSESTGQFLAVTSSVSLTATRSLIAPLDQGRTYTVQNSTTGGQSITVIGSSGTGVTIPNGATAMVESDGTNYFSVANAGSAAITALTGDGTATGPGSVPFTLAAVNSNVGVFGDGTTSSKVTVNAKGLITAISTSEIIGANWAVTDWYLDPVSGSDSNTGLTSGSPLKTFARLWQLLGPQPWVFGQATTIHLLSNHTSLTDPFVVNALFANGGSLVIDATSAATTAFTGTIATLTAKVIGNPGQLLAITATSWTPTKGQLVVNTTRGSCALVEAVSGSTATMCQPYTNIVVPAISGGVVDNTWAATDAITVLNLGEVNIGYLKARYIEHGATFQAYIQVYRAQIFDPTYSGSQTNNLVTIDGHVAILESWITRTVNVDMTGDGEPFFLNTGCSSALYGGNNASNKGQPTFFEGGFIGPDMRVSGFEFTGGTIFEVSGGVLGWNGGSLGTDVYIYASGGGLRIFGDVLANGSSSAFWGPGFVAVFGCNLTWVSGTTTATALFQCAAPAIDSAGYANALDTLFDPAIIHPNRNLTAANIDATVSSGGFNGRALGIAGGFIGIIGAPEPTSTTTLSMVTAATPADSSPHVLESFTLPASPAVGTVTLFDVSWVARDTTVGSNDVAGKLSGAFANFIGTATQLGSSSATVFGSGSSLAFSVSGANVNLVGTGTGNIVNWTLKTVLTPNLT